MTIKREEKALLVVDMQNDFLPGGALGLEGGKDIIGQINELMDLSFKEVDHATRIFLQWFVAEQVEEESSASKLAEKVKLAGSDSAAILVLDQELLRRQPDSSGG